MGVANFAASETRYALFGSGLLTTIKNGTVWGCRKVAKIPSKCASGIQTVWLKIKPYIKEIAGMVFRCIKWSGRQIVKLAAHLGKKIQIVGYKLKLYIKEMPRIIYESLKFTFRKTVELGSKLGKAIQSAWLSARPHIKDAAYTVFEFLKANPAVAAVGSTLAGCACFYASSKVKWKPFDITLKVLGCAAFVLVGVSLHQSMA